MCLRKTDLPDEKNERANKMHDLLNSHGELRAFLDSWMKVSHGICPACFAREYPEYAARG